MKSLTPPEVADFERLEKTIEKGKQTFVDVGLALTEIRERKLYRKDFDTFEAYCQERWGWTKRRGNQLISAASVVEALPENLGTIVPNEATARELGKLPVPQQKKILQQAEKTGEPVTAATVKKSLPPVPIIKKKVPPPVIKPATIPEEPRVRDKNGHAIPKKLVPLWEHAEELSAAILAPLEAVRGILRKLQESKDKAAAEASIGKILASIDQAYTEAKTIKPYSVCTSCKGLTPENCGLCCTKGIISKFRWNTVPEETKKLWLANIK